MWIMKYRTVSAAAVAVVVAAAGVGLGPILTIASGQNAPLPAKGGAGEEPLKKAMQDEARTVYEQIVQRYGAGAAVPDPEELHRWSVRWLEAGLDLAGDAAARTAALRAHMTRMQDVEKLTKAAADTGVGRTSDAAAGRFFRAEAELWVARGRTR
jgi:hypothetical protein